MQYWQHFQQSPIFSTMNVTNEMNDKKEFKIWSRLMILLSWEKIMIFQSSE